MPPETRYGTCSNNRVVWAAPYQPSSVSATPSGIITAPAIMSHRSVTTSCARRRTPASASVSSWSGAEDFAGSTAKAGTSVTSVIALPLQWARRRCPFEDVVGGPSEPSRGEGGADEGKEQPAPARPV